MSLLVVSDETLSFESRKKTPRFTDFFFLLVFISFSSALIFSIPFLLLTLGPISSLIVAS